jgi:hypothetical protein
MLNNHQLLISKYQELSEDDIEAKKSILEELNEVSKDYFGEIIAIGDKFLVFIDPNKRGIVKKYMILKERPTDKDSNQPYLKYPSGSVYLDDTSKDRENVIFQNKKEYLWYRESFGSISGVIVPAESYTISNYPYGGGRTVVIDTEYVPNIVGDISNTSINEICNYANYDPDFANTIIQLIDTILDLAEDDMYPNFLGVDNFAIYKENNKYQVALIDPHIVWIGKECREDIKIHLDNAIASFKKLKGELLIGISEE